MKNLAEILKNTVQIIASALQVALLALLAWGGWTAYRSVTDYLNKPVTLPEIRFPELPGFGPKQEESPGYWRFDTPGDPAVPPSSPPRKLVV